MTNENVPAYVKLGEEKMNRLKNSFEWAKGQSQEEMTEGQNAILAETKQLLGKLKYKEENLANVEIVAQKGDAVATLALAVDSMADMKSSETGTEKEVDINWQTPVHYYDTNDDEISSCTMAEAKILYPGDILSFTENGDIKVMLNNKKSLALVSELNEEPKDEEDEEAEQEKKDVTVTAPPSTPVQPTEKGVSEPAKSEVPKDDKNEQPKSQEQSKALEQRPPVQQEVITSTTTTKPPDTSTTIEPPTSTTTTTKPPDPTSTSTTSSSTTSTEKPTTTTGSSTSTSTTETTTSIPDTTSTTTPTVPESPTSTTVPPVPEGESLYPQLRPTEEQKELNNKVSDAVNNSETDKPKPDEEFTLPPEQQEAVDAWEKEWETHEEAVKNAAENPPEKPKAPETVDEYANALKTQPGVKEVTPVKVTADEAKGLYHYIVTLENAPYSRTYLKEPASVSGSVEITISKEMGYEFYGKDRELSFYKGKDAEMLIITITQELYDNKQP